MLKNKKFLLSLLLLFLIAVVAACGGSDNNDNNTGANNGNDNGGGETTADGQEIFSENCMSCHGEAGEGASGPALQGDDFAADLDSVIDQVKEGGSGMPAFEGDLSEDEIEAVSKYVTEEIANK
ncbi:MAG TPA: cytochrome c [Bacillota bacterium]|nr:cytochrome c [Bacillota bacterium]